MKRADVYEVRPSKHVAAMWADAVRDLRKFGWLAERRRECYSKQLAGYLVEAKRLAKRVQKLALLTVGRCVRPTEKKVQDMRREDVLFWPLEDTRLPF